MTEKKYLQINLYLDFDHKRFADFIHLRIGQFCRTQSDIAVKFFYALHDQIPYAPYVISDCTADYSASRILTKRRGYCDWKAILLCALAGVTRIPSLNGSPLVKLNLRHHPLPKMLNAWKCFYGAERVMAGLA